MGGWVFWKRRLKHFVNFLFEYLVFEAAALLRQCQPCDAAPGKASTNVTQLSGSFANRLHVNVTNELDFFWNPFFLVGSWFISTFHEQRSVLICYTHEFRCALKNLRSSKRSCLGPYTLLAEVRSAGCFRESEGVIWKHASLVVSV